MTVARMVHYGLPDKQIWRIRATRLTVLFVWIDVVCFLVQVAGGGMLSNDEPNIARIGTKVYTAGVAIQMVFVIIFGAMTTWFYRRTLQVSRCNNGRMKGLTLAMFAVLLLIVVGSNTWRLLE